MITTKISQLQVGEVSIGFTNEGITLKQGRGSVTITEDILDIIKETLKKNGNGVIVEKESA